MSKPVIVDIPHNLGRAQARQRLQEGFSRIGDQMGGQVVGFKERWEGDRLHFQASALGQNVSGRVDVEEANVRVEIDLPWILAALAEQFRGRIQKEGTLLLGR